MKYALGIDLGGTELRAALVDEAGVIISQFSTKTAASEGPLVVLSQMKSLIGKILERNGDLVIEGVGVGSPGPLDPYEGVVINAPTLRGWINVPLQAHVSEMTGLRTVINNDSNVGALGEFHFGAGVGYRDIVYVSIGTGIGGGVIIDGKLLLGRKGLAAEIGHMSISEAGPACNCGNLGCWEALASGGALTRLMSRFTEDSEKQELLEQEAKYLGIGITNLLHIFSPECVILGGGVSKKFTHLIGTINRTVQTRAMPPFRDVPIVAAKLGECAGVVGAASLILR